jgi:hypothetical protein
MSLDKKDLYRELGESARLMLRWRHGLFAGFLPVNTQRICIRSSVVGAALAPIFLLIDRRCHEVLKKLEKDVPEGVYTDSVDPGLNPRCITHTAVLQWMYISSAITLPIVAVYSGIFGECTTRTLGGHACYAVATRNHIDGGQDEQ